MSVPSRFEHVPHSVFPSSVEASRAVAAEIAALIRARQAEGRPVVLGLATGSTPLSLYAELIRLHKEEGLSFASVTTFNLDEYYPLPPSHPQSYRHFMQANLFDQIDIPAEQTHVPDGTVPLAAVDASCQHYEEQIRAAGGIDFQILGIGRTGHIGFNEPGSARRSRTRMVTLDPLTRRDAAGDFGGEEHTPRYAITMGVRSILEARRVVLMAWGQHKAEIVRTALEGPVTSQVTASFLQEHDRAEFILDHAAAGALTRFRTPWLLGPLEDQGLSWDVRMIRRAILWLAQTRAKPILKLTDDDYNEAGLQDLLAAKGSAYTANLDGFYQLQHTITGWPGGRDPARAKPGDAPVWPLKSASAQVFPKRVLIFSPHPDDDVISMGGTLCRLVEHGHEVHIAYQVTGANSVSDEAIWRTLRFVAEGSFGGSAESDRWRALCRQYETTGSLPDTPELHHWKALIRQQEAIAAARICGVPASRLHFLDLPFLPRRRPAQATGRSRYPADERSAGEGSAAFGLCGGRSERPPRHPSAVPPCREERLRSAPRSALAASERTMALPGSMGGIFSRRDRLGRPPQPAGGAPPAAGDFSPRNAEGLGRVSGQRSPGVLAARRGFQSTPGRGLQHPRTSRIRGYRSLSALLSGRFSARRSPLNLFSNLLRRWSALSPTRLAWSALPLLPVPSQIMPHEGRLPVTGQFRFVAPTPMPPAVTAAVGRMLTAWQNRIGAKLETRPVQAFSGPALVVEGLGAAGVSASPVLGEDESYTLEISSQRARLRAQTASGVYRGLASLQQLLTSDTTGWCLPGVTLHDRPRFPWRGLLVDVSRRWKPVAVIERTLDGMALVKLNVLHFHLTDDQGFRVESKRHPELTSQGSDGHFYTQAELREIVAYAAARGIRVVPEFDLPGHATSWLVSHPELSSGPGPYAIERHWGVFDPVMDPSNEGTYALLSDFFAEMAPLFPDPYVHLGGDENNGVQWSANLRIQAFIHDHRLKDNPGLHAYFNQRVGAILAQLGKRMIGWDEILHPDLPRGDVIESWRGAESLASAAQQGFAGILAHGFYLDLCHPAADDYRSDPLPPGSALSAAERARILGGEASMWGEWVSPETIDSRIWPRAAAVAERLWSPAEVRDTDELYRRLEIVDLRLAETGLQQRSYLRPAARRLLGGEPRPADVDTLLRFLAVLEPVQDYNRGKLQPGSDQWTPLIGIADAARPDSAEARHLASAVAQFLTSKSDRAAQAGRLSQKLDAYRAIGIQIRSLADHSPGLAPAAPLGFQLEDAAQIGLAALWQLMRSEPSSAGWSATSGRALPAYQREASLARLTADAEPHDAVTLALIEPIRQLVLAAAAP